MTLDDIQQSNLKLLHNIKNVCMKEPDVARLYFGLDKEVVELFVDASMEDIMNIALNELLPLGEIQAKDNPAFWQQIFDDITHETNSHYDHMNLALYHTLAPSSNRDTENIS